MATPQISRPKPKKRKKADERQPAPSATPDRGEEASLEKQANPASSPALPYGSEPVGPAPSPSVVGSREGVVEAAIPDGPSPHDD
jgi:hypothetical protein